jgi:hypothetical protein
MDEVRLEKVPASDLQRLILELSADGYTVTTVRESDGTFTVKGTRDIEIPPRGIKPPRI